MLEPGPDLSELARQVSSSIDDLDLATGDAAPPADVPPTPAPSAGQYHATFPPEGSALASARHAFVEWLTHLGADDESIADWSVVFSEIGANAIEASSRHKSQIAADAWQEDGDVLLEVFNQVATPGHHPRRWDFDDPLRDGGRGLLIVHALTTDVSIGRSPEGAVIVCCRRRLRD